MIKPKQIFSKKTSDSNKINNVNKEVVRNIARLVLEASTCQIELSKGKENFLLEIFEEMGYSAPFADLLRAMLDSKELRVPSLNSILNLGLLKIPENETNNFNIENKRVSLKNNVFYKPGSMIKNTSMKDNLSKNSELVAFDTDSTQHKILLESPKNIKKPSVIIPKYNSLKRLNHSELSSKLGVSNSIVRFPPINHLTKNIMRKKENEIKKSLCKLFKKRTLLKKKSQPSLNCKLRKLPFIKSATVEIAAKKKLPERIFLRKNLVWRGKSNSKTKISSSIFDLLPKKSRASPLQSLITKRKFGKPFLENFNIKDKISLMSYEKKNVVTHRKHNSQIPSSTRIKKF